MTAKPVRSIMAQKKIQKVFKKIFTEPYYDNPVTPFVSSIKSKEFLFLPNGRLDQGLYKAIKKPPC